MIEKIKKDWQEFRRQLTANNIKILICSAIFPALIMYGWTLWYKLLTPIMEKHNQPKTLEESIITLCLVIGFSAPLFCLQPSALAGLFLGKELGIYKDSKTRYMIFDDVSYHVGGMPEEQREKIREILEGYRSKTQLRKDAKKNQSWFRRNFT